MPVPASIFLPQNVFNVQLLEGHIDLAPELRHSQNVQVTQFPIGKNAYVTDHAIVKPLMFSGQFICSNSMDREGNPVSLDRLSNAWEGILRFLRSRQTVQVATAHITYSEMLLIDVSRAENNETGTALVMDFQMQQIQRIGDGRRTPTEEDLEDDGSGDGSREGGTRDRGVQPLENATYNSAGEITSGIIPLANEWYQRQETALGANIFSIQVSYLAEVQLWTIDLSDVTGKVTTTGKLFAGPRIDISYGSLEVLTSANVDAYPPLPSSTGPWGTNYRLLWRAEA